MIRTISKDKLLKEFPGIRVDLPVVLVNNNEVNEIITKSELETISSADQLIQLMKSKGY